MKKPRRRIQKARRRAERRAAAVARYMRGRNARLSEFGAQLRAAPGFVETFRRGPNADTLTLYQRSIVERLRNAGQVVVVVDSRYASATPCDHDASDDTKGALNVHAAAAARTPLVLRRDQCDEYDICYIERRDHDGRKWDEPTEHGSRFMASRRLILHADIEGTPEHMLAIADAIRRRSKHFEKRCAVEANRGDAVAFWSPRNSHGDVGIVTLADADELAAQIVAELGGSR